MCMCVVYVCVYMCSISIEEDNYAHSLDMKETSVE